MNIETCVTRSYQSTYEVIINVQKKREANLQRLSTEFDLARTNENSSAYRKRQIYFSFVVICLMNVIQISLK